MKGIEREEEQEEEGAIWATELVVVGAFITSTLEFECVVGRRASASSSSRSCRRHYSRTLDRLFKNQKEFVEFSPP